MSIIEVVIKNNIYRLACNDGEESELKNLVNNFNERINNLSNNFSQISDNLIFIIAGIKLEEELQALKKELIEHKNTSEAEINSKNDNMVDIAVSQALDAISEYVEHLNNKLENSKVLDI